MTKATLSYGTGPGSSVSLAPEVIKVRNALIEKFIGEPLEDMNQFMNNALANETDNFRRLGILAARIYILRNRITAIQEFNRTLSMNEIPKVTTSSLNVNLPVEATNETGSDETDNNNITWTKLKMTEAGEVNGVRFLAGTIIDAKAEDATKLIESNKAITVDESGNEITAENEDGKISNTATEDNNNDTDEEKLKDAPQDQEVQAELDSSSQEKTVTIEGGQEPSQETSQETKDEPESVPENEDPETENERDLTSDEKNKEPEGKLKTPIGLEVEEIGIEATSTEEEQNEGDNNDKTKNTDGKTVS